MRCFKNVATLVRAWGHQKSSLGNQLGFPSSGDGSYILVARRVLFLLLVLSVGASAFACKVPVFRYALERWAADPFEVLVYHRGPLPAEAARLVAAGSDPAANLVFTPVDLDTETDPDRIGLWEDEGTDILPWMILTYPRAYPYLGPAASGPATPAGAEAFARSPARAEIIRRLTTGGDSAVWVVLESGAAARDDAVASLVEERLAHLQSTLELPTLAQEDIDAGLVSVSQDELRVQFSSLRLPRDQAGEEVLVEMLLDSEDDLLEADGPLVFPVFGRGRVLYALLGEDFNN